MAILVNCVHSYPPCSFFKTRTLRMSCVASAIPHNASMVNGSVYSTANSNSVKSFAQPKTKRTPTLSFSLFETRALILVQDRCNGDGSSHEGPNHLETTSETSYKWRLVIAYDGTHYAGWQYQLDPPTVQCLVEKALSRATKLERKDLRLVGASRTDTGVHAWGQVAHFVTPCNYDSLESVHAAINGLLPSDIRVREMSPAISDFHARFSAESKVYHYKIYNHTIMDPFLSRHAYHSAYKLNTALMREGAKHFVGNHDFSAFSNVSRNDRVPNPVKHIFRFDVNEMGALLQLEVEGSGFLYRQVRNMVALLLQIGRESLPPDIVPEILASRDRKELAKYALSAPPHGLCLVSIKYNEQHLHLPSGCPETSVGRHRTLSKCKLPFF